MHDDKVIYMGWQEEAFAEIRGRLEAENVRYRAALVEIAERACDELNGCASIDPYDGCRTCVAHVALEEKP